MKTLISIGALCSTLVLAQPVDALAVSSAATDCPGVGTAFRTPVRHIASKGGFHLESCVDANADEVRGWVRLTHVRSEDKWSYVSGSAEFAFPTGSTGPIDKYGEPLRVDAGWQQIGVTRPNYAPVQPYTSRAVMNLEFAGNPDVTRTSRTGYY
ncbi:hypothetical protein [Nonomuraea typhae]|uniref:Secreted protein n=1 Tax=Nonomuraea typhae TaxID=2603600 RepID=A0ABW7YXI9_9ACTN